MKFLIVIFCFAMSIANAQSSFEQSLYETTIDIVVDKKSGVFEFLSPDGGLVGSKEVGEKQTVYFDRNHRIIKKVVHPVMKDSAFYTPKKAATPIKKDTSVDLAQVVTTKKRGRKTYYYNSNGALLRTSKVSRSGKKVVFKDGTGKIIGIIKREKGGVIVYQDGSRRITGKSHVNLAGVLVYEPYNGRVTPQFLLTR